jgi:hypothetical protein
VSDAIHDSGAELLLGDFSFPVDSDDSPTLGQTVVVCKGIMKGASGTLISMKSPGHCLVELCDQKGRVWACFPTRVLRTN